MHPLFILYKNNLSNKVEDFALFPTPPPPPNSQTEPQYPTLAIQTLSYITFTISRLIDSFSSYPNIQTSTSEHAKK